MAARPGRAHRRAWAAAAPDAASSPARAWPRALVEALGAAPLRALAAVVAIGHTTAAALADAAVPCVGGRARRLQRDGARRWRRSARER